MTSTPCLLPRLLNVDEVAAQLGVSSKTVRRWIDYDKLTTHRLGRLIRISELDLLAFVNETRQA